MATRSHILDLLEAPEEPTFTAYRSVTDAVLSNPSALTCLAESDMKDDVLVSLTTNSDRLPRLFHELHSVLSPETSVATGVAAAISTLLTNLLGELFPLLRHEPRRLVELLIPALQTCLLPSPPLGLRNLTLAINDCEDLLDYLVTDQSGAKIIQQWTIQPATLALDVKSRVAWGDRMVNLMKSCRSDHGIASTVHSWQRLQRLRNALQKLEMKVLKQEDIKAAKIRHNESDFPPLDSELKELLLKFQLSLPESSRMIQRHISTLSSEVMPEALRAIASTFPCKNCIPGSKYEGYTTEAKVLEKTLQTVSDLQLDVFGKVTSEWKIILSEMALKSLQLISRNGPFKAVHEALIALGSGNFRSMQLVGSSEDRKRLKVPLWRVKFSRNSFILWQVSVGHAENAHEFKQMITIWGIGDSATISKGWRHATLIQRSYSEEMVDRCQRHLTGTELQLPLFFFDRDFRKPLMLSPTLDVRTVDPQIVAIGNRFYAFTEPVIRSIIDNNLAAEFPFDLSQDEMQCIRHFQTATLILGRSGTGKTACLVFKLVGKYLASKALPDERPARQVLLTRSKFLAERLQTYTRRLVKTLSPKVETDTIRADSNVLATIAADTQARRESVLMLTDSSFPLEYWPRLPHHYTKNMSVHLVFVEIMGVMKGSELSRYSLEPLNRESYLQLSGRVAPNFESQDERSRMYDIFERYEALKNESGGYDNVDRVVKVLDKLRKDASLRENLEATFHEIYVDEIQDQRPLDIELFFSLVRDGRGFHFAGDTAQAISNESTFRFEDVKKMAFDHFVQSSTSKGHHHRGHPEMFLLSKNYRSHQGILALASFVIKMIWSGYPHTIDKLDSEIGSLNGPKPLLIIGCDEKILLSSNVGSSQMSEQVADFGAEQVILVRDQESKQRLQDVIGDAALVFTVLESKGMEFDDVILWNFFSGCPNQPGVRGLAVLGTDSSRFDSKRYSDMCLELKNFYVAVTRARTQLFIVESVEGAAASVKHFLADIFPKDPLIEVTGPNDKDFAVRVEMMRASKSLDSEAWDRRAGGLLQESFFREAIMTYRKAHNSHGETIAKANLMREEGRLSQAKGDKEGFRHKSCIAYEHFKEAGLVEEGVEVLIDLERWPEASELLLKAGEPSRAATLFSKAGMHFEAFRCHDLAMEYDKAAKLLQTQRLYDEFVAYLARSTEKLSATVLRSSSILCKLLLKQKKISNDHRKYAIQLLGSPKKQEACFVEYGMNQELETFYTERNDHGSLFGLLVKTGKLDQALLLGLDSDILLSDPGKIEDEMIRLLDCLWIGHWRMGNQGKFASELTMRKEKLSLKMSNKCREWGVLKVFYDLQSSDVLGYYTKMEDTLIKKSIILRKVLDSSSISTIPDLYALPFGMIRDAVFFARRLVLDDDPSGWSALLLLLGCYTSRYTRGEYIILEWSPFKKMMTTIDTKGVKQVSKQYFVDNLASTMLALDSRTKTLWSLKWPQRCFHFLTRGICRDQRSGQCRRHHDKVKKEDCSKFIKDLLIVGELLCQSAFLYHQRSVTNETFSKSYLGIRRGWLERLIIELNYLSALEQESSTIFTLQGTLSQENEYIAVRSSLEDLLYYRIGREWAARNSLTSLLQQMQLSEALGPQVESRFVRALSSKLDKDNDVPIATKEFLKYLNVLLEGQGTASEYQANIAGFRLGLNRQDVEGFFSFHSLIIVFERLLTFLLIKTCASGCVLTKSWVTLHVPKTNKAANIRALPMNLEERYKYHMCIIHLAKEFCDILERLDRTVKERGPFPYSGKARHFSSLMQRSAEMLLIILLNSGTMTASKGLQGLRDAIKKVIVLDLARANNLTYSTSEEICRKLAASFQKYNDKDHLLVVTSDLANQTAFHTLRKQPGVRVVSLLELCPRSETSPATDITVEATSTATLSKATAEMQYSVEETKAVSKIQKFWRRNSTRLQQHRSYMGSLEAILIERMFALVAQNLASQTTIEQIRVRGYLISHGLPLHIKLDAAAVSLQVLQTNTEECIEKVEITEGVDQLVDQILTRNREADRLIEAAKLTMSDDGLKGSLVTGLDHFKQYLMDVSLRVQEAAQAVEDSGTMVRELRNFLR